MFNPKPATMKKSLLFLALTAFCLFDVQAQWQAVSIPGVTTPVSTVSSYFSSNMFAGTRGDGVFYTADYGNTWTDISSNLGNKDINYVFGDLDEGLSLLIGTTNGAYIYFHSTGQHTQVSSGLDNNDVTYFGLYPDNTQFMLGTNGGGVYLSPIFNYSWTPYNNGLTGDALTVNAASIYETMAGEVASILGTNNGVYVTPSGSSTWEARNIGLTGNALRVNDIFAAEIFTFIATDDGVYMSFDLSQGWMPALPGVKINKLLYDNTTESFLAFGESNFSTADFQVWSPLLMGGMPQGEVISAALADDNILAVLANPGRSTEDGGAIYRGLTSMVVSSDIKPAMSQVASLNIFPNPVKENAMLRLTLPVQGDISVVVSDLNGKTINSTEIGKYSAGTHQIAFNAGNLSAGLYVVSIAINGAPAARSKMIIVH